MVECLRYCWECLCSPFQKKEKKKKKTLIRFLDFFFFFSIDGKEGKGLAIFLSPSSIIQHLAFILSSFSPIATCSKFKPLYTFFLLFSVLFLTATVSQFLPGSFFFFQLVLAFFFFFFFFLRNRSTLARGG